MAKASPFIAGIAVAATGYAGRYSIQAWQAFKARPPTARLRRFYDGGFQPAMTRREAALIHGIRGSKTAVKENRAPRQLTSYVGKTAGRNSAGRITIFHRGGGAKRLYRRIDLKRSTSSMGIIERIEYDPNRSSRIALVRWENSHHHFQKKCSAVDEFVPPCKILEPTTAATRGLFSLSSLSSGVDQRKVACPPRLGGTYAMVGSQTGMLPELKSLFASNDAGSKKTCARDVFLSAFSNPSSNRKIASLPPSYSLNFPRITVAGAKPVYFAAQMREKDGGKSTFSLSEIRKWHPNSILWAHRIKRKAAVSWQSFRWQDTLGFAEAADSKVSKPEADNVSSHAANSCKPTS